jgi:hypothetical protein
MHVSFFPSKKYVMIHDYICLSTSKMYKVFHYNKLLKYDLFRCRLKQDSSMDNKICIVIRYTLWDSYRSP